MTQAEMGKLLHRDAQTIARWEKGVTEMEPTAEMLIRKHAIEHLDLNIEDDSVDALSELVVPSAVVQQIVIDGHDSSRYFAKAA